MTLLETRPAALPAVAPEPGPARRWRPWPVAGLLASLAVLLHALRPSLDTPFGMVDDHEVVELTGRAGRLPLSDVPGLVLERSLEPYPRFRPGYWLLRGLESALLGDSAVLWHGARLVLAAVTLVALYVVLLRLVSWPVAAVLAVVPLLGAQAETWTRLGPNEAYGLPLLCVGVALLLRARARGAGPAGWVPALLALAGAGLCKENFLLVGPVVVAVAVLEGGLRRLARRDLLVLGGYALVTALDLVGVLLQVRAHSSLYGQERSWAVVEAWARWALGNGDGSARATAALVAAALLLAVVPGALHRWRWVLAGTAVAVVLQLLFYAGAPQVGRYLYPLALVPVLAWALAAHLAADVAARLAPDGRDARHRALLAGVVLLALYAPVSGGVEQLRAAGNAATVTHRAFQDGLDATVAAAAQVGATTVVLQPVDAPADVEQVLSIARALAARSDLRVMTTPAALPPADPFAQELTGLLQTWSAQGRAPLVPFTDPGACVALVFGDVPPLCPTSLPAPG